jgi:glycosyltransferase involved in cell wall biosynthesis
MKLTTAHELSADSMINDLRIGGAERLLVDLVRAAPEAVDFEVLYLGSDDTLVPSLQSAGAAVHSFDEAFRFDPRALYRLSRHLRRTCPDVLHLHLPYAQTLGRLAASATPCSVVSTYHSFPSYHHPVTRTSERVTRPLEDASVAVSQGLERALTGRTPSPYELGGRWCTIYNGIDVQGFHSAITEARDESVRTSLGIPPSAPVVLNVGRYTPIKGQEELVRSFAAANSTEAHLVLVGYGPLEEGLRETAANEGVTPRVHVTGRISDVGPYYALADVFALPSRAEGFGVVLLEAMAAELPVTAADIRGVREVVLDDETGFLYPPGDRGALTGLLDRVIGDTECTGMGRAGFHRARRKFSSERMAETYVRLYESLAGDDNLS